MNTTDFNEACKCLAEVWRAFGVSLQEAMENLVKVLGNAVKQLQDIFEDLLPKADEKSKKPNWIPPAKYRKKDYLHNQKLSAYQVDRRLQKNLPYQRRSY